MIKDIKRKIQQDQLIITRADKGNMLIIMHKEDYNNKIEEFIMKNDFVKLLEDVTKKQHKNIRNTINNSTNIINKEHKWNYINMNPKAPQIYKTIKLHKQENLVRPIANWKETPGYKLVKHLNMILKHNAIQLPNTFNISNSNNLTHSIKNTTTDENTRLRPFDIVNMHTNIPISEVKSIVRGILNNSNQITEEGKKDISHLFNVVINTTTYSSMTNTINKKRTGNVNAHVCHPS
jgi:hypothetical protein